MNNQPTPGRSGPDRSARRARGSRAEVHQLGELLGELTEMSNALAGAEEALSSAVAATDPGPYDPVGREMIRVSHEVAHVPGELNSRVEALRREAFTGTDRLQSVRVTLDDAGTRMDIRLDEPALAGVSIPELEARISEAHTAAAEQYRAAHRDAQDWIDGALGPVRGLVVSATADPSTP